ncbi:MAG: hypothetical protein ACI860_000015 [Chitinophagales bacterium]|jgi:hypothetical protein
MRFFYMLTCLLLYNHSKAQHTGAKQQAMAGTSITSFDVYAASNSIAASAFVKETKLGLFFSNSFLFPEINSLNLSITQAIKHGNFAYTINYFGFSHYNTSSIGFGYANQFGENLGLGLRFNYHRISIIEHGSKSAISFDLGLLYSFNEKVRLSISIRNPAKQQIGKDYKETLPTNFIIGASFHPNSKIDLAWQFEKDLQLPLRAILGINYRLHSIISLRTGISIHPLLLSGGLGLSIKKTQLDISSTWDTHLGYSPQISISYVISKKKQPE